MASYEDYLKRLKHKKCTEQTQTLPLENEVRELKEKLDKQKQEYAVLLKLDEKRMSFLRS